MRLIVLWGPTGAGKTYQRTTDATLTDLPYVDLMDIMNAWERTPKRFQHLMHELFKRIRGQHSESVVVEGHFLPRSPSRMALMQWAAGSGHEIEWRECAASIEVRRARLNKCIAEGQPRARQRLQHLEQDRRKYGI